MSRDEALYLSNRAFYTRRSDHAWKKAFADAGLELIKEQLQLGFPEGLYPVKL